MIVTQTFQINGTDFIRTFSDMDMKIEREGILYDTAEDPAETGRTYTESEVPIEDEITAEEALEIIMGGTE